MKTRKFTRRQVIATTSVGALGAMINLPLSTRLFSSGNLQEKEDMMNIFYIPKRQETGRMWDTLLYWHEGTYYLYYLSSSSSLWDNISLAISSDGVQWNEMGPIMTKGKDRTWMANGAIWKSLDSTRGAKFQMAYSEEWPGTRTKIFFAESDDLVHWRKLGDEYMFAQDERWYEPEGRWDGIWTIPRPQGGMYGYWSATPKYGGTYGQFGFGQTLDGIRWEALPPPRVREVRAGEVAAIEKIGDRYYMLFGTYERGTSAAMGLEHHMVTLVAESPEGPFTAAKKNRMILAGGDTFWTRFFPTPDGLLVNHHSIAIAPDVRVALGLLKRAVVDDEYTLRLAWWEGNDKFKLKRNSAQVKIPRAGSRQTHVRFLDLMDVSNGVIIEGEIFLPPDPFVPRRGFYIEYDIDQGLAILFDAQGRAELSLMKESGATYRVKAVVDREMIFGSPARWRIVLEDYLAELYLDDILIQCFSLPARATGRIGLIDGGEPDAIRDLRNWR